MKKVAVIMLFACCALALLESCSDRLCPAYSSYPEAKARRR